MSTATPNDSPHTTTTVPPIRLFDTRIKRSIAALAALIVGLFALFVVYAIIVTPERQPYRDARTQYRHVYDANIAIIERGTTLGASTASDAQFAKNTDALLALFPHLKAETDALGKKDVLTKGEGKVHFDTFRKKIDAYISYNQTLVASMQKVRPVVFACSQTMNAVVNDEAQTDDDGAAAVRACATRFAALNDIADPDYKTLVVQSATQYEAFATALENRLALADPKGVDATLAKQYSVSQNAALTGLTQASATFSKNLNTHKQAVDITESAMALDDYLTKKSRIF